MSVTHIDLPEEFNVAAWFVDRNLEQGRGERVAIEYGPERVTYREVFERVNRLANALRQSLGVRREERVALLLHDTPDFAYGFFGAIRMGAVAVPLNTLLKPHDYEHLLNDCRARV
ncbi:MAG TPA: AMP-binding protein, partial [Terriglobales bacterium]|nr:AMP-binding protein [Terriglobales bacterium]